MKQLSAYVELPLKHADRLASTPMRHAAAYQDIIDATLNHHYIAWVHLVVAEEPAQRRLSVAVTLIGKCHEGQFNIQ